MNIIRKLLASEGKLKEICTLKKIIGLLAERDKLFSDYLKSPSD